MHDMEPGVAVKRIVEVNTEQSKSRHRSPQRMVHRTSRHSLWPAKQDKACATKQSTSACSVFIIRACIEADLQHPAA
jgi:hypothetical protein